jgi:hypothetical protein
MGSAKGHLIKSMETNPPSNPTPAEMQKPNSAGRYVTIVARVLMGLLFVVFGLNGFLHFIPEPKHAMPD